jgi:hypothetical protein
MANMAGMVPVGQRSASFPALSVNDAALVQQSVSPDVIAPWQLMGSMREPWKALSFI